MTDEPLPGMAPYIVRASRQLAAMWSKFGPGPAGETCKNCVALRGYRGYGGGRRTYYKCSVYGVSSSEATDWRLKWPACGYFEKQKEKSNG